jgi:hypothetical protein
MLSCGIAEYGRNVFVHDEELLDGDEVVRVDFGEERVHDE